MYSERPMNGTRALLKLASSIGVRVCTIFALLSGAAQAGGFTLAHSFEDGSPVDQWARQFGECAQEAAGIYFEVISGGAFGGSQAIAQGAVFGKVDAAIVPVAALDQYWEGLQGLRVAGLWNDPAVLSGTSSDAQLLNALQSRLEDKDGLAILGLGWQHGVLVGNDFQASGVQGMRIRTFDDVSDKTIAALGAKPIELPGAEVQFAMNFGVIDGSVVGLTTASELIESGFANSVYVADDYSPFAYPLVLVMNQSISRSFGADLLDTLREECAPATAEFNANEYQRFQDFIVQSQARGAQIFTPTIEDKGLWQFAVQEISIGDTTNFARSVKSLEGVFLDFNLE